jgi:hypothetical protein
MAAIKELAAKKGRTPTLRELDNAYGMSKNHIQLLFGTFTEALAACGLSRQDKSRPITTMQLFESWAALVRLTGRLPTRWQFHAGSEYDPQTMVSRFGPWQRIPATMLKIIQQEKLEASWGDVAELIRNSGATVVELAYPSALHPAWQPNGMPNQTPKQTPNGMPNIINEPQNEMGDKAQNGTPENTPTDLPGPQEEWEDAQAVYGIPINHPAMTYAPTNEAGVSILFGAMARELGFVIMRSQTGFPDVEAMRLMKNGRMKRELVELEYLSGNFRRHAHDAKRCGLIVCWEHNWPECPVEVIELRKFFKIG